MLELEEVSGVLLRVDLLLHSSGKNYFQTKYLSETSQTFTPRTLGETLSDRRPKRLDRLRDAVSVRLSPVDLAEKI